MEFIRGKNKDKVETGKENGQTGSTGQIVTTGTGNTNDKVVESKQGNIITPSLKFTMRELQ